MRNLLKKEKRVVLIIGVISLITILGMIGVTYSYFAAETTSNMIIAGSTPSMDLGLTVTKIAPADDGNLIPQLDDAITSAVVGTNNKLCVDNNNNAICNVYKIVLKNNSQAPVYVDGTVELTASTMPNLKWARISGTSSPLLISDVNAKNFITLTNEEYYEVGEEKEYYVVVWLSEIMEEQNDSGSYTGVVTFNGVTKSLSAMTLEKLGLSTISGTPNFSKTSCSSGCGETTVGIYETTDDLGTSYYFRGNVTNNYVKFGKNSSGSDMYWRIIRINGDGSVRIIYDGTQAYANGTSSEDRQVGKSLFSSAYNDNAFHGYMNGTVNGSSFSSGGTNSTTYDEAHANISDSTIKTFLEGNGTTTNEGWYKDNIIDTGYSSYVADAIYCNDRRISSGIGFGTNTSSYIASSRLYTANEPTLKCSVINNSFTETTNFGNGKLKYPVGLITDDEVVLAGGYNASNTSYYLYTGQNYWTMTPNGYSSGRATVIYVDYAGKSYGNINVFSNVGVRPVISLKADVLQYSATSNGTMEHPFVVG